MPTTYRATFMQDYTRAWKQVTALVSRVDFPTGGYDQAISAALNDEWQDGSTLAEWVARTAARFNVHAL